MRLHTLVVRILCCLALTLSALHLSAARADALERLCDPSFETTCRNEIINRIRAEISSIEVGTWFFEDKRFTDELMPGGMPASRFVSSPIPIPTTSTR